MRLALTLLALFTSCVSSRLTIPTEPTRPDEEALGRTEGEGTGFMLFQVIPISWSHRFEHAYEQAVQAVGADRLVDVRVSESWYWALIGNGYVFKVEGLAVKKKRAP